ncbi:MAG: phospholipase D family protein [Dehalococcoidia bacterium]
MAKFLVTSGVSHYLEQLIKESQEKLILISPYLKMNERIKQLIEDKDRLKIDIRVIYGKKDLEPSENNWLKSMKSLRSSFCQNLHAKCYLNEKEAIVTSMNLYDFSEVNNNEMGIYVSRKEDPKLYSDIYDEAMRLVRTSAETETSTSKITKDSDKSIKTPKTAFGFCIRCHTKINLQPKSPYCKTCYNIWNKYRDGDYVEEFCHICGKPKESTMKKPACRKCYKKYEDLLEFPVGS